MKNNIQDAGEKRKMRLGAYYIKYILFIIFFCLLGIVYDYLILFISENNSRQDILDMAGFACEETDETSIYTLISPRTLCNVIETINIPKEEHMKCKYSISSGRASQLMFFMYEELYDKNNTGTSEHGVVFGSFEDGLLMRWDIVNDKYCKNRVFSFPDIRKEREIYRDIDGDNMCDSRYIRINGKNHPEILFNGIWLSVYKWYGEDKKGALVDIDGKIHRMLFNSSKWTVDSSFENNDSSEKIDD